MDASIEQDSCASAMSGLEVLGAIASSIELAKVIHSYISFIREASHTSKHEAEQTDFHFHLLMEVIRFETWCESIGAATTFKLDTDDSRGWKQPEKTAQLKQHLDFELRISNEAVARLTLASVRGLAQKFEDAWNIIQSHRPESASKESLVSSTASTVQSWADSRSDNARKMTSKNRWSKFARGSRQEPQARTPVETRPSVYHRVHAAIKWTSVDKKTLSALLDDISKLNDSLLTLLAYESRKRTQRQVMTAMLDGFRPRDAAYITSMPSHEDFAAMAQLKTFNDKTADAESQEEEHASLFQPPQMIHIDDLKDEKIQSGGLRSICRLDEDAVLLEWKVYSKDKPIRMERSVQLGNLVSLLNQSNVYERFHAPKCKGLVNDDANDRVGLVFAPNWSSRHATPHTWNPCCVDLQTVIRNPNVHVPSVGERFRIATLLTAALHQLHSVNWLHKSLRSDNVLFFQHPENGEEGEKINETAETGHGDMPGAIAGQKRLREPPAPLPMPYILGWNLSRPSGPSQFTETVSTSTEAFQSSLQNRRLYTHPEVFSTNDTPRTKYRAEFDVYSLGLMLLEIGLWRTLDTIRVRCRNDSDFRERLSGDYCDKLIPKMGNLYWRATQRCIAYDFEVDDNNTGQSKSEQYRYHQAFEKQIIQELRKCQA